MAEDSFRERKRITIRSKLPNRRRPDLICTTYYGAQETTVGNSQNLRVRTTTTKQDVPH